MCWSAKQEVSDNGFLHNMHESFSNNMVPKWMTQQVFIYMCNLWHVSAYCMQCAVMLNLVRNKSPLRISIIAVCQGVQHCSCCKCFSNVAVWGLPVAMHIESSKSGIQRFTPVHGMGQHTIYIYVLHTTSRYMMHISIYIYNYTILTPHDCYRSKCIVPLSVVVCWRTKVY